MIEAAEAAFAIGELDRVQSLLDWCAALPEGERIDYLQGHEARFRARLAAEQGDLTQAAAQFETSCRLFRGLGMPFPLAVSLLEHAECLRSEERGGDPRPLLGEARDIFQRLKTVPWLERLKGLEERSAEVVTP
jgi:hypothetical protein